MTIIRIPETASPIPGAGRLGRHIDSRTPDLRTTGGPPPVAPNIISVEHQSFGLPLNQGEIGSCTANALCGALNSVPHYQAQKHPQPRALNEADAVKVYGRETKLEGEPYPPNDPGGTGQLVCEAAIQLGLCSDFQVAQGVEEALKALVLRPVITGINWMTSFDTPDKNGLITITPGASVRGGHEIVADKIDAVNELVWFWNSWGTGWGVGGRFCMTFATWNTLLEQDGDAVVPRTAAGWVAP